MTTGLPSKRILSRAVDPFSYRSQATSRLMRRIASSLALAALCAAACSSPAVPTEVPATSAASASLGEDRTLSVEGRDRQYLVYVPKSIDKAKPSPLLLYLHRSGQTRLGAAEETELNAQAERLQFVVVYLQALGIGPSNVQAQWNWGCCQGDYAFDQKVDDVAYARQVIQKLTTERSIDPERIYVAGFSAGAIMTYRIACEAPQLVAAVAAISGVLPTTDCAPPTDLSLLEIHGTQDDRVPYEGCSPSTTKCSNKTAAVGPAATMLPVEQAIARLRGLYGCPTPTVAQDGPVTRTTASPCRGGTEVTLITAVGGFHKGPLGSITGGSIASTDVPEVVKFVLAHRRPPAR
jgi:polyhydroxybutyrate depolymerase